VLKTAHKLFTILELYLRMILCCVIECLFHIDLPEGRSAFYFLLPRGSQWLLAACQFERSQWAGLYSDLLRYGVAENFHVPSMDKKISIKAKKKVTFFFADFC